jgi:hypothetical protein
MGRPNNLGGAAMTPEQARIVECWERHEHFGLYLSEKRLVELVSDETGEDVDTIIGALMAGLEAGSAQ